ncbi:hypothetical protein [Muricauda sp. MAR_2010_75]|uniref:hypothetical protein n=1 Tax=Allomuricauda sp. MAR_2010_75 TaxID=1250232 RepID=UPI000A944177|nr:hypothetical protein [Muricauda sp. MAR_2010_75]
MKTYSIIFFRKAMVIVLVLTAVAFNTSLLAQTSGIDYENELDRIANIPNSPESMAFERYGNMSANLYNGTPDIKVPIHTIKGREMELPIFLTYDATGIRVDELATWTGAGWNLVAGGRISRIVNGLPDEYINTGNVYVTLRDSTVRAKMAEFKNYTNQFPNLTTAQNYFSFLEDVNTNSIDTQLDYFSVNVPGLSGTIVFDPELNMEPKMLENPRVKITIEKDTTPREIEKWTITGEDGRVYIFDRVVETTENHLNDVGQTGAVLIKYYSTWMLTEMVSPNGKDVFDFTYTWFDRRQMDLFASSASLVFNPIYPGINYYEEPNGSSFGTASTYYLSQQFLTGIQYNGFNVATLQLGVRYDTDIDSALDQITFYNTTSDEIKEVDFYYGYFNMDGVNNPWEKDANEIRLKLDSLGIKGNDDVVYEKFRFDYISPDVVPPRGSKAQDYLGLYNGKGNNTTLYTKVELDDKFFEGADREPDSNYSSKGLLSSIVYPTGGKTQFSYEGHTAYHSISEETTQGLVGESLNSGSPTTPELYVINSAIYCDDEYLDYEMPKILIKSFTVPYTGVNKFLVDFVAYGNAEAYIMKDDGTSDYNHYCDFYQNIGNAVWHSSYITESIDFEQGDYKLLLLLDDNFTGYGSTSINVYRPVTTTEFINDNIGGNRISSISEYTRDGKRVSRKSFEYEDEDGRSTGVINYYPTLYYLKPSNQLVRMVNSPRGDQPFVTYSSVKEIVQNSDVLNPETIGHIRYKYNIGNTGVLPNSSFPFENNYTSWLRIGQQREKYVYDVSDSLLVEEYRHHFETQNYAVNSMVVYQDESFQDKIIAVEDVDGTAVRLKYLQNNEYTSNTICPNATNYGYITCFSNSLSALRKRTAYAQGFVGGVDSISQKEHFPSLQKTISRITTNNYDANVDYLLRRTLVSDSRGGVINTSYYYPKDQIVTGYNYLEDDNQFTVVMRKEVERKHGAVKDEILGEEREYTSLNNGQAVMPSQLQISKGNAAPSIASFQYDSDLNLKDASRESGPNTAYVWGYDEMYPLAKGENISNTDLVGAIGWAINNMANKPAGVSTIEDLVQHIGDMETTSQKQVWASFNSKLRENPAVASAMVTTYTYKPMIGLTSITDAMENVSYYEYDAFNRLKTVKDIDDNITSDFDYNYRNQQQD